jgi:hypothetical protein
MPYFRIPRTEFGYALVAFDANGHERADDPDGVMTERIISSVSRDSITDIFMMSHGWKGDIHSAKEQYDAWVSAMVECKADLHQARQGKHFRPLVVGLHWPSQPWGDEEFSGSAAAALAAAASFTIESQVDEYARRIAGTPEARAALRTIFAAAQRNRSPNHLPEEVQSAYAVLNHEAQQLSNDGEGAAPGDDREPFDPEQRYEMARQEAARSFGGAVELGDLLSPLRQLSFWKMKDRARQFGEYGGHAILRAILEVREGLRVHLVGHSFGCIVMSASLAGPPAGQSLLRPVQSLVLIQGALSLWSYCSDIPYNPGRSGYFRSVMSSRRVTGPIITTRSRFDTAVSRWYPLGAGVARQITFEVGQIPQELPKYGAVGTFGLQGPGLELVDLKLKAADQPYAFEERRIFNLECSEVIRHGEGSSGAHSDIAHPEVAHAIWSAALA